MKKQYIVVDLETTWLSKEKHAITEIWAVRFDGKKILDSFQTLVNPERHIPSKITALTGITNEMVADAPLMKYALSDFHDFLGDDILVAHNATFDFGFLTFHSWNELEHNLTNDVLCTRKLANRLLPDLKSKSLHSLCQYYSVVNTQAHRALADVYATVEIFANFLRLLEDRNIDKQWDILGFQDKSIKYCW